MSKERLMQVLLGPHVSEKSTRLADAHHQVVFRVRRDAHKDEIRRAVELLFDVKVDGVTVLNQRGKRKRFAAGRGGGARSDWKKAYVQLAPGHDINFMGGE
jgi:large subunit ribosomal protein L23